MSWLLIILGCFCNVYSGRVMPTSDTEALRPRAPYRALQSVLLYLLGVAFLIGGFGTLP